MSPSAVSVSNSAICASPKSRSRTSIDLRLGEEHVRRLDVAVDDPAAMGVRERIRDLRRDLDRGAVVDLAGAQRLPQRAPRDVLVGDVDVRRVARQRDDPLAALVSQGCGRAGLALGAVARLAFARDDLQRDVEAGSLVAREPHVAHAARAERPERAVPAEKEVMR